MGWAVVALLLLVAAALLGVAFVKHLRRKRNPDGLGPLGSPERAHKIWLEDLKKAQAMDHDDPMKAIELESLRGGSAALLRDPTGPRYGGGGGTGPTGPTGPMKRGR